MLTTNKRKIAVMFFLAVFMFLGIAAYKPGNKPEFKNLQVLPKDISKDSLDKIMDEFKAALGVRCDFCHARSKDTTQKWPDFASDDKPEKNITRYMMRMTTYINVHYFNFDSSSRPDTISVIKCITCHRGNPHPEVHEDSTHHDMPPGMPPPPPGQPKPEGKEGQPPPPKK